MARPPTPVERIGSHKYLAVMGREGSEMKARQWLRNKTLRGKLIKFAWLPGEQLRHGGIAGSLVGLGHIKRTVDGYILTRQGSRWIGVAPNNNCPA